MAREHLKELGALPAQLLRGEVEGLEELVDLLKTLMESNRATGQQVTTGDRRPGRSRWVAGRAGLPCRRCGAIIRAAPSCGPR